MKKDTRLVTVRSVNDVALSTIGEVANIHAARQVFQEYREKRAKNTLKHQLWDLHSFVQYLAPTGYQTSARELQENPMEWAGVTHGLVDGFKRYLLQSGYAIGTVNLRLSTIKTYCELATRAGAMTPETLALIKLVKSYKHTEGRNIDEGREQTRRGTKKAEPVLISQEQANTLIQSQPDSPQGRRDTLLLCLLLDHGLRCGEIADLPSQSLDLDEKTLTFYRKKVGIIQKHELTEDTYRAAKLYLEKCVPGEYLLLGSSKGGCMSGRMSERAITARACVLCKRIGIMGASAHDGRHAWVTFAIRNGTDLKSLQDGGGWTSPAMPMRYAASQAIANRGIKLGK